MRQRVRLWSANQRNQSAAATEPKVSLEIDTTRVVGTGKGVDATRGGVGSGNRMSFPIEDILRIPAGGGGSPSTDDHQGARAVYGD